MKRLPESAEVLDRLSRSIEVFLHRTSGCEGCTDRSKELAQLVVDELTLRQGFLVCSLTQVGSLSDGGVFYSFSNESTLLTPVYEAEVVFGTT